MKESESVIREGFTQCLLIQDTAVILTKMIKAARHDNMPGLMIWIALFSRGIVGNDAEVVRCCVGGVCQSRNLGLVLRFFEIF